MPPPPPPSASYLLKFDTTDEESSEDDVYHPSRRNSRENSFDRTTVLDDNRIQALPPPPPPSTDAFFPSSEDGIQPTKTDEEDVYDEDTEDELIAPVAIVDAKSKRKKKKKKRSKKKKKKKQPTVQKHVAFRDVTIQEFERALGSDVVPLDGCWPLGLGEAIASSQTVCSVEEYESAKQERLKLRHSTLKETSADEDCSLPHETRQWDYRCKDKNPLFRINDERERMHLLLGLHESNTCNDAVPKEAEKRGGGLVRRRSGRVADCSTRKQTAAVHYNDVFTKLDVMHSRNELEKIRTSRRMEGSIGCSCRKLNVYLLPPNAGKKAHHRRMNLPKVKDELRKRHLLPDDCQSKSRDELERMLHDAVADEPCCAYDCPCWANGIGCQADACDCWRHNSDHNNMSAQDIETSCGNPEAKAEIASRAWNIVSILHTMCKGLFSQKKETDASVSWWEKESNVQPDALLLFLLVGKASDISNKLSTAPFKICRVSIISFIFAILDLVESCKKTFPSCWTNSSYTSLATTIVTFRFHQIRCSFEAEFFKMHLSVHFIFGVGVVRGSIVVKPGKVLLAGKVSSVVLANSAMALSYARLKALWSRWLCLEFGSSLTAS